MILIQLTLENYGLFSGVNNFSLTPRIINKKRRPVVLFGGKNGAGKTTFLDAIRLLLYGRRSQGSKLTKKEYDNHLLARVHRNKNENTRAKYAKVGLVFEHVLGGEKHLFNAVRSWEVNPGDKIVERFHVLKDGKELDEIGMEHQEAFIADIVPERLSQLFFFDGEKIKGIAEDISSNEAIAEAIQSLLGLDAVLSLKSDLTVYRSRILKNSNPEEFKTLLGDNAKETVSIQEQLEKIQDGLAEVGTKIQGTQNEINSCEKKLADLGGSFAGSRSDNQEKANSLKEAIKLEENAVRECLEATLPFAMCPSISANLSVELTTEETLKEGTIACSHIEEFSTRLSENLDQIQDRGLIAELRLLIKEQQSAYCEPLLTSLSHQGVNTKHGLSKRESQQVTHLLAERVPQEANRAKKHLMQLEKHAKALHDVSRDLEKAPDEVDVKDIFDNLAFLNRELGVFQEKNDALKEEERQLSNKLALVQREGERIAERMKASEKDQQKLDYIKRMVPALDVYKDRLTEVKINTLQAEVTECFNLLARKSDFVKGILVDPKTFQVSVVDEHNRSIPKEDLSSGEKQIFAIAMLWGLARTSGRPLPVVVDTPLGRLDSDHRTKLIENYFPNAGHQVILLSTDTEVDQGLFETLSPAISHTYHLEYQHDEGRTRYKEEYFWRN